MAKTGNIDMNKYLMKIAAMTAEDATSYLYSEYNKLKESTGATDLSVSSPFDSKYWDAISSNGARVKLDWGKKVQGKIQPEYSISYAEPHILTRLATPIYPLFQSSVNSKLLRDLVKVHEGLEAEEFDKHVLPVIRGHSGEGDKPEVVRRFLVSGHINPAVIMRESNVVSDLGDQKAFRKLIAHRRIFDNPWLKLVSGKSYGDRFSEEDLNKARSFFDIPIHSTKAQEEN